MSTHQELTGVYQSTRWQSDDATSPYVIGQLQDGSTVKGPAEQGELQPNILYKFFGKWQDGNARFGKSFAFVCAVKEMPHSRQAVVEYLTRLLRGHNTGIGEKTAHKLYDAFESDSVRKLRMDPTTVGETIHHDVGLCRKASAILDLDRKFEDAKIALVDLFAGSGFPRDAIKACIDRWGAAAPAQIKRDAFLLLSHRIPGAGFLRCDKLYLGLGGDPGKLKRQVLCAHHELRSNNDGHTWYPVEKAIDTIKAKIAGSDPNPIKALKVGGKVGKFAFHWPGGTTRKVFIADGQHSRSESDIARLVCDTSNLKEIPPWPAFAQGDLDDHQYHKLQEATTGRVGILSGSPGTGKSHSAAVLIREIVSKYGPDAVVVCAPTGKAAVRIGESMERYAIPLTASTIHRLLLPNDLGHGTGDWNFQHTEANPLRVQFVVVDEFSMVSTDLAASLLRATKFSRLLFIGDMYQLPPISHGSPLRDLIDAGIPNGEMTVIRRNSGAGVAACHAIKNGKPFQTYQKFDDATGQNLRIMPAASKDTDAVAKQLKKLFDELREENPLVDLVQDCQILTGTNITRNILNPIIQNMLNHDGERVDGNPYRVGDKVICLSNDGYTSAENHQLKCIIFNGEQGRVEEVTNQHVIFNFPNTGEGERRVKQPIKGELASAFSLAYAITFHKAQGAEWPIVVCVTEDSADQIACREFWYTGLSRFRHRCVILGSLATVGKQCKRVTLRDRKTFLVEKINAERNRRQPLPGGTDGVGQQDMGLVAKRPVGIDGSPERPEGITGESETPRSEADGRTGVVDVERFQAHFAAPF